MMPFASSMKMADSKPKRTRRKPSSPAKPRLALSLSSSTPSLQPRIFINYRRSDTQAAADHLYESLAALFGHDRVFLDRSTIQPGNPFPRAIEQSIQGATIFLALIGPGWLNAKDDHGKRRLPNSGDYVRLEIESALKHKITVIPVMVDGAKMPSRTSLPPSLWDLTESQWVQLPWREGIQRIAKQFTVEEEQRARREAASQAERAKLDLGSTPAETAKGSFNVVANVIELSLARQGKKVSLDYGDIWKSLKKLTGQTLDNGFIYEDLIYVIDHIGVKARGSNRRYVARSFPVATLKEVRTQISMDRPVLAGITVFNSWWEKSVAKTGIVDVDRKSKTQGGTVCAIVGFDPVQQVPKLLTPWPTFGKNGVVWLTRAAAEQCIGTMRSIEATLKVAPYTKQPEPPKRKASHEPSQKTK